MRIIPVLDLKAGRAVHAVAGARDHYQPVRSNLHEGSDSIGLARAFRDQLGLHDLYLADLDAITGDAPPSLGLYRSLCRLGLNLWVDAGLREADEVWSLLDAGVSTIVAGLETVPNPEALASILIATDPASLVFSIDLKAGKLLGDTLAWNTTDPLALVENAVSLGLRRILLLDLAQVGTGMGIGTEALVHTLLMKHPQIEVSVGGGISGSDDVEQLAKLGVSAVLVASALHDGRITAADCQRIVGDSASLR